MSSFRALRIGERVIALSKPTPVSSPAPTEAERTAQLRELLGPPDTRLQAFPDAIRAVVNRKFDRHVKPLFAAHWPEALSGSTQKKLRFLSCQLYATAPYTVLFSSPHPPFVVRVARGIGTGLRLDPTRTAAVAALAVRGTSALLDENIERRIVQIATFIATIDHVMDKCMDGVGAHDRGRRMRGALDGTWTPDSSVPHHGAFAFLRALKAEMGAGIDDDGARAVYANALARVDEYIEAEVQAMSGVPDPEGLSWRMPGVIGTIEGLIFPVIHFAGPTARRWMVDVSYFVQVMDDWIDLDKDRLDVRETPCLTGAWTFETVREAWTRTLDGIVDLARESGMQDERYLSFVRETYRAMTIEVMEAMCRGSAA
jgi:hypothetical protein